MSTEPFIGEIKIFGFNFAPQGYQTCQGQLVPINQNQALFSLLGTFFGGDGVQTFQLPDLQGRMPIGQGNGAGLPSYAIGQKDGSNAITLQQGNLPPHAHPAQGIVVNMPVSANLGDSDAPNGAYLAKATTDFYSSGATAGNNYGPLAVSGTTGITGSSVPLAVMNPYQVINYCIATTGIFPSRQ